MIQALFTPLWQRIWPDQRLLPKNRGSASRQVPTEVQKFLGDSYPSNHCYAIVSDGIIAKPKLAVRYRHIKRFYPSPLKSFLDVSCCKGFFVFAADQEPTCRRALGIDIHEPFLDACRQVQQFLGPRTARFERLFLHQLAERIPDFGGRFQTLLLINTYPYFYFGSELCPQAYATHAEIFRLLREVCSDTILFANRTEWGHLPSNIRVFAERTAKRNTYNTQTILASASQFFHVSSTGTSTGGYPLYVMKAR